MGVRGALRRTGPWFWANVMWIVFASTRLARGAPEGGRTMLWLLLIGSSVLLLRGIWQLARGRYREPFD